MSDMFMLTTIDNPYSPFKEYEDWIAFDTAHQYNTNEYLARVTLSSNELSALDNEISIDHAMNLIVIHDPLGIYIKVKEDFVPNVPVSTG